MKLAEKRKRENSNIVGVHRFRPDPSSNPLLLLFNSISASFEGRKKVLKQKQKGFWRSRPWCVITTAVSSEVEYKEKRGSEREWKLLAFILFVHGDIFNLQS